MKILSCVGYGYYDQPYAASYEYVSFVEVPRLMGHKVHHFDYQHESKINREAMNEFFLSLVKYVRFDLVVIVTHLDEFLPPVLDEAKNHSVILGWNCDDDFRWYDYSSKWIKHFSYMVTTNPGVYQANKILYPNLLLSQWGCTGLNEGKHVEKDIDIGFVGLCYGKRREQLESLRKELRLVAYGKGVEPERKFHRIARERFCRMLKIQPVIADQTLLDQESVKNIWNRSKISFTPLDGSRGGTLQIKARVFDMGLSGTLMLCTKNDALSAYYQPDSEYVQFETIEECIDKAKYYLAREDQRRKIAEKYYQRTKAEHLWQHRFNNLFSQMGLEKPSGKATIRS